MSKLCFEEKQFCWKTYKFVHLCGLRAEGTFHLSRRLRGRSVQRALTVSWGALKEKQFFRRTHQIFDRFRTLGKKTWGFAHFYQASCQNCIFLSPGKTLRKFFLLKELHFDSSLSSFQPKKMSLAKLHQEHCQNSILCVNETLRGKFNLLRNGKVLFIFFGLRLEKNLEFSENFGKVVRAAFLVSSKFFDKNTFLNSKQFPPTIWTFIREKLWLPQKTYQLECQKCILRVQNNLWRKKVFLGKHVFFDQFLTLSQKSSDFCKILSVELSKLPFFVSIKQFEE